MKGQIRQSRNWIHVPHGPEVPIHPRVIYQSALNQNDDLRRPQPLGTRSKLTPVHLKVERFGLGAPATIRGVYRLIFILNILGCSFRIRWAF